MIVRNAGVIGNSRGLAYTWGASWGTLPGGVVQVSLCSVHDLRLYTIAHSYGQMKRTVREGHGKLEETAGPDSLVLAGNTAFPNLEVEHTLGSPSRLREEAEWVVLTPLLPVITQVNRWAEKRGFARVAWVSYLSSWRRFWQSDIVAD